MVWVEFHIGILSALMSEEYVFPHMGKYFSDISAALRELKWDAGVGEMAACCHDEVLRKVEGLGRTPAKSAFVLSGNNPYQQLPGVEGVMISDDINIAKRELGDLESALKKGNSAYFVAVWP